MSQNKLTPQEKQMPSIRLPLRIAVFCCIYFFVMGICDYILFVQGNTTAAIFTLYGTILPVLCGIMIYSNYRILFDKDRIIYRDIFHRVYRCRYENIYEITTKGIFFKIETKKKTIPVYAKSQNSSLLLELSQKKHAPTCEDIFSVGKESKILRYSPILPFLFLPEVIFIATILIYEGSKTNGLYIIAALIIVAQLLLFIYTFSTKISYNEEEIRIKKFLYREHQFLWEELTAYFYHGDNLCLYFKNKAVSFSNIFTNKDITALSAQITKALIDNKERITHEKGEIDFYKIQQLTKYQSRASAPFLNQNILSDTEFWVISASAIIIELALITHCIIIKNPVATGSFLTLMIITLLFIAAVAIIIHNLPTRSQIIKRVIFVFFTPSLEYYNKLDDKEKVYFLKKYPRYRDIDKENIPPNQPSQEREPKLKNNNLFHPKKKYPLITVIIGVTSVALIIFCIIQEQNYGKSYDILSLIAIFGCLYAFYHITKEKRK